MNPAGDPKIFIPMGVHVGSPAVLAFINDHEENLIGHLFHLFDDK